LNFNIKENTTKYYEKCNGKYFAQKVVEKVQNKTDPPFYYVPKGRFFLYNLITGGIYEIYWFYKNWKLIRDVNNERISPFLRTMFTPIYCFLFFERVKEYAINKSVNTNMIPALLGFCYWFLNGFYVRLPFPIDLIFLIFVILLLFPVLTLMKNIYLKVNVRDIEMSDGEIVFLVIATLWHVLIVYLEIKSGKMGSLL